MPSNLAGSNLSETLSAAGVAADPNGPYTNVGGLDQAATLTLTTAAADVIVTEGDDAISGSGEAIGVVVSGPGQFEFLGDDGYTGGTTIQGGVLDLGASSSAGTGRITFAANAFATLKLASGADPTNAISLPDATDAIDFSGVAFAYGDHLVLTASGAVSTYAVETVDGGTLETLRLTGALNGSSLLVAGYGAEGTEIAAAYSAAEAASDEASIKNSSTRIFISDSATNIAANISTFNTLLDDGLVAAVFVNDYQFGFIDGSASLVDLIGGDNRVLLPGPAADAVVLAGTNGAWDQVSGGDGLVDLNGGQANVTGGGNTIDAIGGAANAVSLYYTRGNWDRVYISDATTYLTNAQASVFGGDDVVLTAGGSGNAVSLYDTGGKWDGVQASVGIVYLTSAQASVFGGGDLIDFAGGSGDAASLYDTSGDWDGVSGSNSTVYITGAQTNIDGGDDIVVFSEGAGNAVSLYATGANLDTLYGSNGTVYLTDSSASIYGGDDRIVGGGTLATSTNILDLYDTGGRWDFVSGPARHVFLNSAQASVFGGDESIIFASGSGNVVSLYAGGHWDSVDGSNGSVYLTNSSTTLNGNDDTIVFDGSSDYVDITDDAFWNDVYGSNGFVLLRAARVSLFGGDDIIDSIVGVNIISVHDTNGLADTVYTDVGDGSGLEYLTSAQVDVVGADDTVDFSGGSGNAATIASSGGWDTVDGSGGTINLDAGYANVVGGDDTIDFTAKTFDAASLYDTNGSADSLDGSGGHIFLGGAQASVAGVDDLIGFSGDASLTIVGGGDLCMFQQGIGGQDVIDGFNPTDSIQLSKSDFADFTALSMHLTQSGEDALITLDASDMIKLTDVKVASLTASQFQFY